MTEPVEQYQEDTEALAASTVAAALAVLVALRAGQVSAAEAAPMVAGVIATANAVATTLADGYVAAHIEFVTGTVAPAVGVPPRDDTERLTKAVETIFDEDEVQEIPEDPEPDDGDEDQGDPVAVRVERLARAEPLQTAQAAVIEVIAVQPQVIGWRRRLDADPCELCRWLYADGRIYRPTTKFRTHPNCNCQPEPVIESRSREEQSA